MRYDKPPFPWFGGKSDAAPHVWAALGDVDHYAEPFGGGLAVLLRRPHPANRTYHSETVNDADGLLTNFWRAVQADPDAVAEAASWPVSELDKHARSCALLAWRDEEQPAHLAGDPLFHDVRMAGWWAWAVSCQIGAWGTGGPWWPDHTGRLRKQPRRGGGVRSGLPHLSDDGRGVNHAQLREPGVGVPADLPRLSGNGRGVNHAQLREPGVAAGIDFHPTTMPALTEWLRFLSARLRHVRILSGDWSRLTTNGALLTLPVRGGGVAGVFLDPPYSHAHRRSPDLYAHESATVADDVRDWCLANGDDPRLRIVLAGYDTEHTMLEALGWTAVEWFRDGWLKGGMGNTGGGGTHDQQRERLWLSPHCLQPADAGQLDMFTGTPA